MPHYFEILIWVICGNIGAHISIWLQDRAKNRYRWKCVDCGFKVRMNHNDNGIFDNIVAAHIRNFHSLPIES